MEKGFFVTGTGTGVGKTLVSLGLCLHFKATYWKPIQSGTPTDLDFIKKFLDEKKTHPSTYTLKEPLSPNQAALLENIEIDLEKIKKPKSDFLIVEGVGGVMVPLNSKDWVMDLMKKINLPLILVAESGLGTLNHSFLSLEALKKRGFDIKALILSGKKHPGNKKDLEQRSKLPVFELPPVSSITASSLKQAFQGFPA